MSHEAENLEIYLKGALEPIRVRESMQATQMNMSAALRNQMLFFQSTDLDGHEILVAIPQVQYMRAMGDDD